MYKTGRGQLKVRGRASIEETRQGKKHHHHGDPLHGQQADLDREHRQARPDKVLEGISDIRDESNREGIRILIELKRGIMPKVVLNNLFEHTQLETTFGAIMLAIDEASRKC